MGKYGKFTGGSHFKHLKKKVSTKRVIETRASSEQLAILKTLGLSFQENSISAKKAQQLIDKLTKTVK